MIIKEGEIVLDFRDALGKWSIWWACKYDDIQPRNGKGVDLITEDPKKVFLVEISDPCKEMPRQDRIEKISEFLHKDQLQELLQKCKDTCDSIHPVPLDGGKPWVFVAVLGVECLKGVTSAEIDNFRNQLLGLIKRHCVNPATGHCYIKDCFVVTPSSWGQHFKWAKLIRAKSIRFI